MFFGHGMVTSGMVRTDKLVVQESHKSETQLLNRYMILTLPTIPVPDQKNKNTFSPANKVRKGEVNSLCSLSSRCSIKLSNYVIVLRPGRFACWCLFCAQKVLYCVLLATVLWSFCSRVFYVLRPVYTNNFCVRIFSWQFLFVRIHGRICQFFM